MSVCVCCGSDTQRGISLSLVFICGCSENDGCTLLLLLLLEPACLLLCKTRPKCEQGTNVNTHTHTSAVTAHVVESLTLCCLLLLCLPLLPALNESERHETRRREVSARETVRHWRGTAKKKRKSTHACTHTRLYAQTQTRAHALAEALLLRIRANCKELRVKRCSTSAVAKQWKW